MNRRASLVLRLTGPLQAWGTRSQFNRRETGAVPSKSGIVGLLAAADGRRRTDPIEDLAQLRLAVRIDEPGSLTRDFHTIRGLGGDTIVTHRYYLQDALFVAVVNGHGDMIEALADALLHPRYPLGLGRRSCPPAHPLLVPFAGSLVTDAAPETIVRTLPWQVSPYWRDVLARRRRARPATVTLSTVVDAEASDRDAEVVIDVPLSFGPADRKFTARRVRRDWVTVPSGYPELVPSAPPEVGAHDPFLLAGG